MLLITTMEDMIKTKAKALEDMARANHGCNKLRDEEIKLRNKEIDLQIIYKILLVRLMHTTTNSSNLL